MGKTGRRYGKGSSAKLTEIKQPWGNIAKAWFSISLGSLFRAAVIICELFQIALSKEAFRKLTNKQLELFKKAGGAGRNRTDDLYNAIVALSQLSYGPIFL